MTWTCAICTLENPDENDHCEMCNSARPGGGNNSSKPKSPVRGGGAASSARSLASRDSDDSRRSLPVVPGEKKMEHMELEMAGDDPTRQEYFDPDERPARSGSFRGRRWPAAPPRGPRLPSSVCDGLGGCLGDATDSSECRLVGAVFCGVLLFISCFLIGFSFRIVDYDEYGLLTAELSGAVIDTNVYETGRHFVGLGFVFVTMKKNMRTVTFLAEGGTSGPISIRTIDGKIIEIEAAFNYMLMEDRIYDIYVEYGELSEEFFVTMARARLRDVAARHTSTEFFAYRRAIEVDMQRELAESMVPRMGVVVEFQLGRVGLPFSLETFLASTQLKKIQLLEEKERLIVKGVRANTTVALEEAKASKEKELTVIRQHSANRVLVIDLNRTEVTETTALLVGKVEADSLKDVAVFQQETENQRLQLVANTTVVAGETAVQEQRVLAQTAKLGADKDLTVAAVRAAADANVQRASDRASSTALRTRAAAMRVAFANLVAALNFNASHFNTLLWQEAVIGQSHNNLYMDTYRPTTLDLPGQREALYDSFDDDA